MSKSELKRLCTQDPAGMAEEIYGLTASANFWIEECEKYKKLLTGCEAALKESRANDMESMRQLNEHKVRADAATINESSWMGIGTAPKDRDLVLFADGDSFTDCVVIGRFNDFMDEFLDFYGYVIKPSHWMPLPKAPKP